MNNENLTVLEGEAHMPPSYRSCTEHKLLMA